ncbi:class I SAM-dependent methyltransferase [Desulfopila sp. IMCC35008]|uniref:class I SAM-dependent methyltransferase n=1 Tax=Desulfopila sp. IMCC35008 TaxID=2653858 RepID=UPI0013D2A938|nr:class I SAM-dependent methyltransferase [Desulfopila sp. IMCC35008]
MKLSDYIKTATRPEVYTPGTATMWDDDHISRQLLAVHLNPELDLASRTPAAIELTIKWVLEQVPGSGMNILDMGCGPGLYTERLARKGHRVTGMDISANSIKYARESAAKNGLDIRYINQDYQELAEQEQFDLILMIFTDFGVLPPEMRSQVLGNIYKALKPGGIFIFDVLNNRYPLAETGPREWEVSPGGFWKPTPHLVLQEKHHYPDQQVTLSQHIVADEEGEVEIYRFWTHAFDHGRISNILADAGFGDVACCDNILPDTTFCLSNHITFCMAVK